MPRTDHLVSSQFKSGDEWTGNAGGRPKGESLTAMLRAFLRTEDPKTKKTYGERVVKALVHGAIKGKPIATQQLWDRVEGKVPQTVQVASLDDIQAAIDDEYSDPEPCGPDPVLPPPDEPV